MLFRYYVYLGANVDDILIKQALVDFHRALKYRKYYLAASLFGPVACSMLIRAAVMLDKKLWLKYQHVGASFLYPLRVPLLANIRADVLLAAAIYLKVLHTTLGIFSFGTNNSWDPLNNMEMYESRFILRTLRQKFPGFYKNNIYQAIERSPECAYPNQSIKISAQAIAGLISYTPLQLAKEIGSPDIVALFEKMRAQEYILYILSRAWVTGDGDFKALGRDPFIHILSFVAGSNITYLAANAPGAQLAAVSKFITNHAAQQRKMVPQLLTYFEAVVAAQAKLPKYRSNKTYSSLG
jgi:hypothetical protein